MQSEETERRLEIKYNNGDGLLKKGEHCSAE